MARHQEILQAAQASGDRATAMLANVEARRPILYGLDDDVFSDGSNDESSEEEVEEYVYYESSDQEMEDNDDPNDSNYTP